MAKGDVGSRRDGVLGFLDFPKDVTAQTRETAYSAYNELARAKVKTIGLNFDSTDYMNSAGIGLVISLVEDATQAGRKIFAFGLGSHYRKLFNMVGLTERVTLVADENEVKLRAAPPAEDGNQPPPASNPGNPPTSTTNPTNPPPSIPAKPSPPKPGQT